MKYKNKKNAKWLICGKFYIKIIVSFVNLFFLIFFYIYNLHF